MTRKCTSFDVAEGAGVSQSTVSKALRGSEGVWPTTSDLAALCGVSRSHLSRGYVTTTGTALSTHAAAIRHERAQDAILQSDQSIAQIAHRLGFASASAFGAAFRRTTGMTPHRYRTQGRLQRG